MSAAEKLRTLEQDVATIQEVLTEALACDALDRISDALPQILAVVEAAENFVPHMTDEGGCHPDHYGVDCPEWLAVPAALAALDVALEAK